MLSAYPIEDIENPLGPEEELILKPFHYEEHDNFENSGNIALHIYCHDRNSNTVNIRINNFSVHCCLELPETSLERIPDPSGDFKKDTFIPKSSITWDHDLSSKIFEVLCEKQNKGTNWKTKQPMEPPFGFIFKDFKDIYYYTKEKKYYMYLYFHNLAGRNDMMNTINFPIWIKGIGYLKFVMHENKITTFRRLHSKQDIKYTQWISVKGKNVPISSKRHRVNKETVNEYIVDYTTMKSIPDHLTSSWFVYPKMFSWDCEMYSENHKQMPSSKRPHDAIYLISVVFQYMEHPETMRKICLCYGECDEIPGVEVLKFNSEKELLIAFFHLFGYFDPDIVIGYNTSGFDYPYIIGRLDRNNIQLDNIPSTGRLLRGKSNLYEMNWNSSGGGKNSITLIQHNGRIDVDMLPNIRRLYKLRQYTLQFVSMTYLKEGKHDIKASDMFKIYEDSRGENKGVLVKDHDGKMRTLTMTDVAAYCVQDSILPIRLFDNRKIWYHLSSLSSAAGVSMMDLFTRGEQIRCYSNIADKCYKQGKVLSNPQYFDYYFKGGFVGKPQTGVYKYVFTLDFASLYPSIMRAYNISIDSIIKVEDWTKFDPEEYEINYFESEEPIDFVSNCYLRDLEAKYKILQTYHVWMTEYQRFLEAKRTGQYIDTTFKTEEEYIRVLKRHRVDFTEDDYNTMREMGLSNSKKMNVSIEDATENISFDPDYFETSEDLKLNSNGLYGGKRGVMRRYEIRIIKKDIYEGIMSLLETEWFSKRKDIKKLMKNVEKKMEKSNDPTLKSEHSVHNAGQNAVKIMMNSGYGFNGVPKGMLPALPVAILVTAIGRRLINEVNNLLLEKYKDMGASIVYNDTDSSMVMLDIKDEDVLSGKVNLEAIMKDMEDFINGTKEQIFYNNDASIKEVKEEVVIIDPDVEVREVIPMRTEKHQNGYISLMVNETISKNNDEIKIETWEFDEKATLLKHDKQLLTGKFKQLIPKTTTKYANGMIKDVITQRFDKPYLYITKTTYNEDATIKEVIPAEKGKFRNELQMECENCTQMCPLKPKYYIKLHREVNLDKIMKNGFFKKDYDDNYEITTKGILTSKKGNSQFANVVYDTLVNQVILIKPTHEMLSSLTKNMCDFLSDKFSPKDLCRVTELGSDYSQESYFMNVFANYLTSQGMPVKPGDRLEYLVVRTRKEIAENITENMGNKCREYTMWEGDPNHEEIDYAYYIEKGLQEQFDFLFGVGNSKIIQDPRLESLGYKPQFTRNRAGYLEIGKSRKKFIHFSTPIKMITALVKDYMMLTDEEFLSIYQQSGNQYEPGLPRNRYISIILSNFMNRVIEYLNYFYPPQ